jgi:hypothetical protein
MKIAAVSPNSIAALDSLGRIFVTHDTAHSWQPIALPDSSRITAIVGTNRTLYIGDDRGKVFCVSFP